MSGFDSLGRLSYGGVLKQKRIATRAWPIICGYHREFTKPGFLQHAERSQVVAMADSLDGLLTRLRSDDSSHGFGRITLPPTTLHEKKSNLSNPLLRYQFENTERLFIRGGRDPGVALLVFELSGTLDEPGTRLSKLDGGCQLTNCRTFRLQQMSEKINSASEASGNRRRSRAVVSSRFIPSHLW